jgi:hypothetical protein
MTVLLWFRPSGVRARATVALAAQDGTVVVQNDDPGRR